MLLRFLFWCVSIASSRSSLGTRFCLWSNAAVCKSCALLSLTAQEILIIIRNSEKYIELRFSGCFPYRLLYCWPKKNWHHFSLKKIFCSWKHEFFGIIGKLSLLFINILFMHLRCCDKLTGFVLYFPIVYFQNPTSFQAAFKWQVHWVKLELLIVLQCCA